MSIFSGLEGFGIKNLDSKTLFEDGKRAPGAKPSKEKSDEKSADDLERESVYDKTYECPICDAEFPDKKIRGNKAKLVRSDLDMRPVYEGLEPLKYDVIMCPHCGYAALQRFWKPVSPLFAKMIKENISNTFTPTAVNKDIYSFDDAIMRYKMALANSMVRRAKNSEKGYICLKTAWIIRAYCEVLEAEGKDTSELKADEKEFLQNAYEGLSKAITTETPPICGMDAQTLDYLVAVLALECDDLDSAARIISKLLADRSLNSRIMKRVVELKDIYREKKEQLENSDDGDDA